MKEINDILQRQFASTIIIDIANLPIYFICTMFRKLAVLKWFAFLPTWSIQEIPGSIPTNFEIKEVSIMTASLLKFEVEHPKRRVCQVYI
jgi:hypothetical protein